MKIRIYREEMYPVAVPALADDPDYEGWRADSEIELTAEEWAEWEKVAAAHWEWQKRFLGE